MWHWTFKSLVIRPLALAASVLAAGLAFLLVLLFEGFYTGESEQIVAYVENSRADVWVMQRGVSNMHMATSFLSDWKADLVAEVPGVSHVDGILYLNTVVHAPSSEWFSYVVGLDPTGTRAGPWAMSVGRAMPGPGEVVVPAVFSQIGQVSLGDVIRIADRELTVVGLSEGTFSLANAVVFVSRTDLEELMSSLDILSFLLVQAEPGVDPETLAADIERHVDDVSALTREQFVANDRRMAMQMGVETIALITVIGGSLALLLVAFTCYSLVTRQRRELAVIRAIGAARGSLYASVMLQGGVVALGGVGVALGLAALAVPAIAWLVPQVTLQLSWGSAGRVLVVGLLVAVAASAWAARQVSRVDPASAFAS
jgi:putative ABC transport system permease protein